MRKELKYGGYSASPNDHETLEGDLAVAMNLIPEDNTIKPVLPPKVIAQIPGDPNLPYDKGRKIVCIHQTSAFKHFIVAIEFDGLSPQHPPYTYLYRWDGTEGSVLMRLGYKAFNEVYKVEPVGNTLVVLTDTGIHYYLWKNGNYHYLGTHLPELDLLFSLVQGKDYTSDEHEVDWDITGHPDVFDGLTPISWFNSDYETATGETTGKEVLARLRQGIMAALNEVTADVANDKRFAYPFFVRYAYRLYDGNSLVMHSAPALMAPTLNSPTLNMGWAGISADGNAVKSPAKISASLTGYKLHCEPLDMSQVEQLALWSDIISSVDIYISPLFYTYNQGAKDRDIIIDSSMPHPPVNTRMKSDICSNATFYLVQQARVSADMPQHNALLKQDGNEVRLDFELSNDNIVVRELMIDDYGTHDELFAEKSFAYNARINLVGVERKIFKGFNPSCMWHHVGDTVGSNTTATVVIETGGREVVVESDEGTVYHNSRAANKVLWFFYPNAAAKRAYMTIDGENVELELNAHPLLNGAYYCSLDEDAVMKTASYILDPSDDSQLTISEPNKIYTSEVNNPFYFPVTGINTISAGNIMGLCAAVRPVSTSQFGYADLYIFADNGVWVAKINDKGTYSNINLATGDICINPDSITQMETTVLFATARGIMLLSGSQAQCISDAIDDKGQMVPIIGKEGYSIPAKIAGLLGMEMEPVGSFEYFLADCRMLYDYTGQRIIVYNPGYNYAYIYSLESHKWGMMQCSIDYSVRAYPAALAVTRDGELVDCSVGDGSAAVVPALLITRPLTLDQPDVLKTVNTVLQRGLFRKGNIKSVLYGSRDLYNWMPVMSSQDENMRGRSGTPYKWYRIALLLQLEKDETVTGCSIQFDPRYTNRIR